MKSKDSKTNDKTKVDSVPERTQEEKLAHLDAAIAKAEEEEDEYTVNYLQRIREMTINVYEGGTVIFQSGKPTPPY